MASMDDDCGSETVEGIIRRMPETDVQALREEGWGDLAIAFGFKLRELQEQDGGLGGHDRR